MLLAEIEARSTIFVPKIKLQLIFEPDDNMILELTDQCMANFIITGNTADFTFPIYKQTKIVTPKKY